MRTKCYSVRLQSLTEYSDKAYKAVAFDGSQAFIPKQFVFGSDLSVSKSDAYWIAAWILERKELQYSDKKSAWFGADGVMLPNITVEKHEPEKVEIKESNVIKSLIKE